MRLALRHPLAFIRHLIKLRSVSLAMWVDAYDKAEVAK